MSQERSHHSFWVGFRQLSILLFVQFLALQPAILAVTTVVLPSVQPVEAADVQDEQKNYYGDETCYSAFMGGDDEVGSPGQIVINPDAIPDEFGFISIDQVTVVDPDDIQVVDVAINLSELATNERYPAATRDKITSADYAKSVVDALGFGTFYIEVLDAAHGGLPANSRWIIGCDSGISETYGERSQALVDAFDPLFPIHPAASSLVDLIRDPSPKIAFANPIDRYALLGERCVGGLIRKPRSQWGQNENPCPGFDPADDVFQNGKWDAPKVDTRVLATLTYLVTPIEQGGAGREFIRVKKLIQYDTSNPLTQPVIAPTPETITDPSEEAEEFDRLLDQEFDEVAPVSKDEEQTAFPSSYYINLDEPPHLPRTISSSVMIDQIDKLRVATKIEQKRLFGNNTVEYKVQSPIPIDVSWQSDAGMAKDPPPDFSKLSMIESSRFLTNAAIVELLNQYGLGDLEINVGDTEFNNLGDIALVVGESLLEQLLGSPRGSLSGYSLLSTLKSIGLAYLEQNLGLVPGSLTDMNPLDEVDETADFSQLTVSVGRATVEYVLGFPRGALRTETGTSNELLESVGRRYLEKQVFQVSDGTLLPSEGYPLRTVGDLLERLGEGRIEHVFKLPKQSLRKPTYDNSEATNSFRQSSFKATLLFPKLEGVTQDEAMFDMADYISGKLSLVHVPYAEVDADGKVIGTAGRNMYGFTESDFNFPTLQIKTFDEGSLKKFKQLVGSRAIETSLGMYRREGAIQSLLNEDSNLAPVPTITIGGITYNARYRPLNEVGACDGKQCRGDDGVTPSITWCDAQALSYVRDGSEGRWVARPGEGDTIGTPDNAATAANIRTTIEGLQSGWGTLNSNLNWSNHSCAEDPTFEWSDPFLGQVKSILLSSTVINQTVFLNQDKAPKRENFYNDGGTKPGEDSPSARYNTATLLYYNLPENHKDVPLNAIPTQAFVTESEQTANPDEVGTPPKTVVEVLSTLINGGVSGKDFTWKADSSLRRRMDMLQQKLNQQVGEGTFDLASILSLNLPAAQLDQVLLEKLNLLTVRPVTKQNSPNIAKFEEQYNDPAYNGWLFIIQDLRQRLDCKTTNGYYRVKEGGGGMECAPQPNEPEPGEDVVYEIQETKRILDRLYKQPWALVQSIIKSLETRTYSDPSGFVNQSAMSAAASLASVKFAIDENLRFKPETVYSKDLVRSLVAPNGKGVVPHSASIEAFFTRDSSGKSLLGRSGIEYAAKKFSTDALGQATFASQLKTDFTEIVRVQEDVVDLFDLAEKDADTYGFNYREMVEKGLANDDFIRIFLLDQGNQVFERVGKEQALRTIWRKSGAASKIKSSEQYQSILRIARESVKQLEFYTDRLQKIKRLSEDLAELTEDVGNEVVLFGKQLKKINASTDIASADSIENVRNLAKRYEPTLTQMTKTLKGVNRDVRQINRIAYEIMHLTQEIVAGRALPRDQKIDGSYAALNNALEAGDPSRAKDSCFDKSTLLRSLTGTGDLGQRMFDFAVEVGTCRLETGLGLPTQSVFMWYKLGSEQFPPMRTLSVTYPEVVDVETGLPLTENTFTVEETSVMPPADVNLFERQADGRLKPIVPTWNKNRWSADNLKLAVGIADQVQRNRDTIDPQLVSQWAAQQSAATINRLIQRGEEVLAATALAKLAHMIPGVGKLLSTYRITTKELAALFQGNMQPLIAKVGGGFIDQAFNLPSGSGADLIYPDCRTNDGRRAPCNKDPDHPQTDPDNVRIQIIAEIGLQKLGLTMPRIPRYFSFRSGGNMAENWGNAVLSDGLRLAPNSFRGSMVGHSYLDTPFVDECEDHGIRCLNRSSVLARAFGFAATPYSRSLEQIKSRILSQASNSSLSDGGSIAESATFHLNQALEDFYAATTLARASSTDDVTATRGYWTNLDDGVAPSNARMLANADLEPYLTALERMWDSVESSVFPAESKSAFRATILRMIPDEVGPGNDSIRNLLTDEYIKGLALEDDLTVGLRTPGEPYQDLYLGYIRTFQKRLDSLSASYNVGDRLFHRFLQGTVDAREITRRIGLTQTAGNILGEYLDTWIDENGPVWLREMNEAFELITAEQCGGKRMGMGTFLTRTVSGGDGCLESLGLFSTADLFYGTSGNMRQLRRILFEEFLGGIFSRDLERQIGFRPGAFLRMVDDPKHARQIIATEGVLMVADRIFGPQNKSSACNAKTVPDANCSQAVVESVLKEAFIAGFCENSRRNKCDFTFSSSRSIAKFHEAAGKAIDRQLRRIGREYLGVEITRKDIAIHHGDMSGIALIGVQFIANSLNNALYKGDPRSPMAKFFTTYYEDIRITMGYDEPPAWALDTYAVRGGIDEMYSYTCGGTRRETNPACSDNYVSFDEYVDTIMREENWQDRNTATHIARTRMEVAGDEAAQSYARNRKAQSLMTIQYALLDIVAFSKDRNIPPNFSKRLLSGTGTDRAYALGEYLVGGLMKDSSSLGKFMRTACAGQHNGTECFNLFKDLYTAIKGGQTTMQTFFNSREGGRFINLLDIGINRWFKGEFGIELPDDTFKGVYVWGMRGFKASDFNREGFCDGVSLAEKEALGGKCSGPIGVPVGRILQDFGEKSLTDWADKNFSLKKGTSAKIVKVAELIIERQKLAKLAIERGWSKAQLTAAKTKNAVAIAQLVSEVIVSIFEQELTEFDQSIGLPPGTSAIIVGAAVTYGAALALGVSGSAAVAAAFGPAFFVALGFNLVFGVTRVVVTNRATGDGYYPFYSTVNRIGSGPATRCVGKSAGALGGCRAEQPYNQVTIHDPATQQFDPTFTPVYRAGLKRVTRAKVTGLLTDLLLMPGTSYMERAGLEARSMRISQLFTYGGIGAEYDPTTSRVISDLLNRGLPEDERFPDWGYGDPTQRCRKITPGEDGLTNICERKLGWLVGFYGLPTLTGAIHIRW